MRKLYLQNYNFWIVLLIDCFLLYLSLWFSFQLRFDFQVPGDFTIRLNNSIPFFIIIKILTFFFFKLYRGMWRYTSLTDIVNISKASLASTLLITALFLFSGYYHGFPRSVIFADFIFTTVLIGTSRISIRMFYQKRTKGWIFSSGPGITKKKLIKMVIIGAGDAGEKILREIDDSLHMNYQVIGFFDDNPSKRNSTIHGISVLGAVDELVKYKDMIDEILICVPAANSRQMRNIVDRCKETGKKYRTLPGIWELIDGSVSIKLIRDVSIVDLLGRKEVHLDRDSISRFISQKNVLITGAGGSIGSELARQCITFAPRTLILLDISEFNLFQIEQELSQINEIVNIVYVLSDIKNMTTTERIFHKYKPDIVFHAAAYKHVPIQEIYPWEAIITNVYGTMNLAMLADKYRVDSFVMVSTDKAVKPTNIMGASKRIAELGILASAEKISPKFMSVRFGNVIGSSGSVIPIFQQQIAKGGPVTVTHRDMTRYFMSIPEASQLILQAGAIGKGGETFILDMGEPVKIDTVARDLIRLSGFKPDIDIEIQYSGIRPGEKMFEELITDHEEVMATAHDKIMVLRNNHPVVDTLEKIDRLLVSAQICDIDQIKTCIRDIVPEYNCQ